MTPKHLGSTLAHARKRKGLSQAALALRIGVSRQTISNMETGRIPEVGLATALRALHAVDMDLQVVPLSAHPLPTRDQLAAHRRRVLGG